MKSVLIKLVCIAGVLNVSCQNEVTQKEIQKELEPVSFEVKEAKVYTTAENSELRLTKTNDLVIQKGNQPLETEISVFVNPQKKFQSFIGIGGAITDASAEVFSKLSDVKREELLNAYYDKDKGIGYSLLRTPIHSSDFSSETFTYIKEGDSSLTSFSIDHDRKYRLPMIKEAMQIAKEPLMFYASPWSPPAFMKDTKNMLQGGVLLPEYFQSWANYYVKFIQEYEKEGFQIWGVTVQNEPMAKQTWESCIYSAEAERDFVKNYLGPTFEKAGYGDKKIVVWDHNRDLMNRRANIIYSDPEASKYVWGMGFHWYENWSGGDPLFENVGKVNESFPDKGLLFTEGCNEKFDSKKYQFWPNAERYGKSMIHDFNNGTMGWTDWNILLDENGGPNHVGNYCFAPIHADTKSGELIFTPSYYYIGHFSKFIRPQAKRISTAVSRSDLLATSFLNTDGTMITVVMNQSDQVVDYNLFVGEQKMQIEIPAHAIQTITY
ncbi:glycosyl hydrolase [Mangrovimonas sp. AS39]|uniref:glycoside hydrolase family 30 protein n=1 Tax=Mangrovimonas futianensis TaxID=2895523 RepID=UPI001E546329|nr:glycoside hydrolase family 30 protein [Mangrovimonas futianensis]MCF1191019.1 glycosyl hydrolase [Mangrovimonas futianensis]MCF1194714.1 glycosyl hydrolase [Mangrovimonas futianensis]